MDSDGDNFDVEKRIKQHDNGGADFDQERYDRSRGVVDKKKSGVLKNSFAAAF